MPTIWKFPLRVASEQDIAMPKGAHILTAQMQGADFCLWAMVEPDKEKEVRKIEIIGTGNPIGEGARRYISTAQMHGGALVWHVFEKL